MISNKIKIKKQSLVLKKFRDKNFSLTCLQEFEKTVL